jgi:hypothetical protein
MSTKTTRKYANTKVFTLHLYDDFGGPPALYIRVNTAEVKIPLSKEELEDINKQLEE